MAQAAAEAARLAGQVIGVVRAEKSTRHEHKM